MSWVLAPDREPDRFAIRRLLTAYLVQRGSAESKPPDRKDRAEDYSDRASPASLPLAGATRRHPLVVYRNSLCIALLLISGGSFVGHLVAGTAEYNEQRMLHGGEPPVGVADFLGTSDFWVQSMQNWQSEFLAMGGLIVLSIVLRQHGSPESKPVTATHATTGG
ncbi:DUF6766 family protein [Plantactinospora sp. GCM10030261]|uniref:DUF6766 family protein n=1 Tax=Plantactinospora sp. GCM10030261 TaxID=3273420 RepID=UPI00360F4305